MSAIGPEAAIKDGSSSCYSGLRFRQRLSHLYALESGLIRESQLRGVLDLIAKRLIESETGEGGCEVQCIYSVLKGISLRPLHERRRDTATCGGRVDKYAADRRHGG